MSYYQVPAEALERTERLLGWARVYMTVAHTAASKLSGASNYNGPDEMPEIGGVIYVKL